MEAARAAEAVDRVIGGKYRVIRLAGEGGMGLVYEAEHLVTRRRVALKVLTEGVRWSQEALERFLQEAQIPAAIGHPNIVEVLDAGTSEDGAPYLVMEFLSGESVASLLARRPRLTVRDAVWIAVEVLDALGAAHAHGVIHRDVKPENVFLTPGVRGQKKLKLLDFGISKLTPRGSTSASRALTVVGQVIGTADYMSPEQVRGELGLDARTDLWAVGVMLYEMLAGERPFTGPNNNVVMFQILTVDAPSLAGISADVTEALAGIVQRALERDPSRRYGAATEMQADLQRFLGEVPRSIHPRRSSAPPPRLVPEAPEAAPMPIPLVRPSPRARVATVSARRDPLDDEPAHLAPLRPRVSGAAWAGFALMASLATALVAWSLLVAPRAERARPNAGPHATERALPVTPLNTAAAETPPSQPEVAPPVVASPLSESPARAPAARHRAPRRRALSRGESASPSRATSAVVEPSEPSPARQRVAPVRGFDEL